MTIRSAHTPHIAWHLGRGDVRGLGPLLSCTHCHRFPPHLLSDGSIPCGSCKAITAHISSDMPCDTAYVG